MRKRVKQTVIRILRRDEQAREDDNYLVLMVRREFGVADSELPPPDFPKFNSICRARAKVQQEGRFRPPASVYLKRQRNRRGAK